MSKGPCAALFERVGGDVDVFAELCELFLHDAARRLARMRAALDAADARTLEREAHALTGAASAFDAEDVVSAARHLEHTARSGDLCNAPQLLEILESHSRTLMDAVRAGKERG